MEALKLIPACKSYLWGGTRLKEDYRKQSDEATIAESWEVSVHRDGPSVIANGEFAGRTLADYFAACPQALGRSEAFPILVKLIDAADRLSVQVHPSDSYARVHENDNGKTEMWYIVDAEPGSGIYCGLKKDSSAAEVRRLTEEKCIEEILNFIPVKAGDCFLIEAGTLHAIGKGCLICEVQQSSNVTYRVYDYGRRGKDGRERELHLDRALEVINYHAFEDKTCSGPLRSMPGGELRKLTSCEYFVCYEVQSQGELVLPAQASFLAVTAISGEGSVNGLACAKGDSFLIPAGTGLTACGRLKLLLSALPDIVL